MKAARRDGVSTLPEEQWVEWEEWGDPSLDKYIKERIYDPKLDAFVVGAHQRTSHGGG